MTEENLKKLLTHYEKVGKKDAVDDILSKYPHLKPKETPKVEIKSVGKK